ncbi:MAG: excinuclease ABC subunit UvrA, partial [Planctomycetaceae bacterium]|nr:excinuclease ABC subunit UvrA [Planctomycetaceae bacterium]
MQQPAASAEVIRIRGARVHNLQNVDLDIPRDQLVVITGLSGSGKSSLAFDTIFAEGQRQYIESLSTYARQFLVQLERADVDLIDGLQPTISVDQRAGSLNPRSTVATATEIYDYLRLLYARAGEAHCPQCGEVVRQQNPEQIVDEVLALPERTKVMVLAPFVRGRKGQHKEVFEAIRKAGFVRVRVDGEVFDIDSVPELVRQKNHDIEAVVDRIVVREGVRPRVAESVQLAVKYADGVVLVTFLDPAADASNPAAWQNRLFSTQYACPSCKLSFEELEPRSFSFNSPYGACPTCEGLGYRVEFDPELIVPDASRSLATGAVAPWRSAAAAAEPHVERLAAHLAALGYRRNTPWDTIKPKDYEHLLRGDGEFLGLVTLLEQQYVTTTAAKAREQLEAFRGEVRCHACGGARLKPEARAVQIQGLAIHEFTALTVERAAARLSEFRFAGTAATIAEPLLAEIRNRLEFLHKVGLDYLTLDRAADSLSGGESQRIRLASGLGSGLVGVCYVLDEPSIGLHQRDNDRLIAALRDLQQLGNSVLVVEHDEAMMREADQLIDLGPGAGRLGGRVLAQGTPAEVARNAESLTGRYLSGAEEIHVPPQRRPADLKRAIVIEGVTTNNLKNVSATFPLGTLICVTGVSGSGKSSLLNEPFA